MKKKRISIIVFILGIIFLGGGIGALVAVLVAKPPVLDADFLVQVGAWEMVNPTNCTGVENEASALEIADEGAANCVANSVIWTFTEIGKGTLTTNSHINDYGFIWAIEGDKLKIETEWLYTLENEYTYTLNQKEKVLTLTDGNSVNIDFRPASSVEPEVTENN